MAVESLERHPQFNPAYTNEDGSYTEYGALMELSKHIIFIPDHDLTTKLEMAYQRNMKPVPRPDGLAKGIALLAHRHVPIEIPRKHHLKQEGEEGDPSDLEYFIDGFRYIADDGRENVIFAARVPKGGQSSTPPHTHGWNINNNPIIEHYFKISDGKLYIGESDSRRELERYEAIPPNTTHHIKASKEDDSVIFMLLEHTEGIPDGQLHLHDNPNTLVG